MLVTMACEFPQPCWFVINAQAPVESLGINLQQEEKTPDNTLTEVNKYWDILYAGWNSRPDIPAWLGFGKGSLPAIGFELAEGFVDTNFEVLNDIRHEKYKNKNLYTDVERDRVGTIGFKPIWSPGGFQV